LVFTLGASAQLPVTPPSAPAQPLDDPALKIDTVAAAAGNPLFNSTCHLCHGFMAVGGGVAPDLRASTLALSPEAFKSVLKGGILESRGMPRFNDLNDAQVNDLYWYVRQRARADATRSGAPVAVPPTMN
jgi:quinohemoprotein ethanol dehydrogenase